MVDPVELIFDLKTLSKTPQIVSSWTLAGGEGQLALQIFRNFIEKSQNVDMKVLSSKDDKFMIRSVVNDNNQTLEDILINKANCAVASADTEKSINIFGSFRFSCSQLNEFVAPKIVSDSDLKFPVPTSAFKLSTEQQVSVTKSNHQRQVDRRRADIPPANLCRILASLGMTDEVHEVELDDSSTFSSSHATSLVSQDIFKCREQSETSESSPRPHPPQPKKLKMLRSSRSKLCKDSSTDDNKSTVNNSKKRVRSRGGSKNRPHQSAEVTAVASAPKSQSSSPSDTSSHLSLLQDLTKSRRQLVLSSVKPQQPQKTLHNVAQVFIHSHNPTKSLSKRLNTFKEIDFTEPIMRNIVKRKFDTMFRIQTYAWPHIHDGTSMVLVNGENTGKTMAFLPPILSMLIGSNAKGNGPTAIAVVSSSRNVDTLYDRCCMLVGSSSALEIVRVASQVNMVKKCQQIARGCHLLITTATLFCIILEHVGKDKIKSKLRHLIFDDLDVTTIDHLQEAKIAAQACVHSVKDVSRNPQIVITSCTWTQSIAKFAKIANEPVILFGNFAEVAIYVGCKFIVKFKSTMEQKIEQLQEFLADGKWKTKQTLIVGNCAEELRCVRDRLNGYKKAPVAVKMLGIVESDDTSSSGSDNDENQQKVLMITDETLSEMNYNVLENEFEVLIHFSMPATYRHFKKRFALMNKKFHMKLMNAELQLETLILMDGENTKELPRIFEFLNSRAILGKMQGIEQLKEMVEVRYTDVL